VLISIIKNNVPRFSPVGLNKGDALYMSSFKSERLFICISYFRRPQLSAPKYWCIKPTASE